MIDAAPAGSSPAACSTEARVFGAWWRGVGLPILLDGDRPQGAAPPSIFAALARAALALDADGTWPAGPQAAIDAAAPTVTPLSAVDPRPLAAAGDLIVSNNTFGIGPPSATGLSALAAGDGAVADGPFSMAFGQEALATASGAVAIGNGARATEQGATALGRESTATDFYSTAVGTSSRAAGFFSTALGSYAEATGAGSVALGGIFDFNNNFGFEYGEATTATGDRAVSVGIGARADALNSVALGTLSVADQANTVSIGAVGTERRLVNLSAGTLSAASTDAVTGSQMFSTRQSLATVLGGGASVDAAGLFSGPTYSILGSNQTSVGGAFSALNTRVVQNSTDIAALAGGGVVLPVASTNFAASSAPGASGVGTIAVGWNAQVAGGLGSALGQDSYAVGDGSAFGYNARAGAAYSTAVGASSDASGYAAIAVGNGARGIGANGVALGASARANADGSVALGSLSVATEADTVSIGSASLQRRLVNVADGTLSTGSTDAVTGRQLFATNQALALNTTGLAALGTRVGSAETSIIGLDGRVTINTADIAALQGQIAVGSTGLVLQDAGTLDVTVAAATGGTEISVAGTAGRRRVRGVADAELTATSGDAVNGGQLFATRQVLASQGTGMAAALGGGAAYNPATGALTAPNYVVLGSSHGNVGSALTTLSTRVQTNTADIGALQGGAGGGAGGGQAAEIAALQAQLTAL